MNGDSDDGNSFHHKLSLTVTHVLRLCKAFANGLSANINFSKTQPSSVRRISG